MSAVTILPDIPVARSSYDQTAVLDSTGRVINFAFSFVSSTPLNSQVCRYDPTTGEWSALAGGPQVVQYAWGLDNSDRLIIAGGNSLVSGSIGPPQTAVNRWDSSSNSWSAVADLPAARGSSLYWTDSNGNLWVLGGTDGSSFRATLYKFDGSSWSTMAPIPAGSPGNYAQEQYRRAYPLPVDSLGRAYATCHNLAATLRYNPGSDSWSTLANMPTALRVAPATYSPINDSIYVITGANNAGTPQGQVFQYNISTDTWLTKTSAPSFVTIARAQTYYQDGFIYLVCGALSASNAPPGSGTQPNIYRYDVVNDIWAFTGGRFAHALLTYPTVVPDNLGGCYFIGGNQLTENGIGFTLCEYFEPQTRIVASAETPEPTQPRRIFSWGATNTSGQLGLSDTSSHTVPTEVLTIPDRVVKVVTNGTTTLFLTEKMEVWSCGSNVGGMLGQNLASDTLPHSVPAKVSAVAANLFVDIAIGGDGAIAIDTVNRLWVWGTNAFGSLGIGDQVSRLVPTLIPGAIQTKLLPVARISCGNTFSAIVSYDYVGGVSQGFINTTGLDDWGQLGRSGSYSSTPVTSWSPATGTATEFSPPNNRFVDISAGESALLVLRTDGTVLGTGRSDDYRLSSSVYNQSSHRINVLTTLSGMPGEVRDVRQAGPLSWFRTSSGTLWSWGNGAASCNSVFGARFTVPTPATGGPISIESLTYAPCVPQWVRITFNHQTAGANHTVINAHISWIAGVEIAVSTSVAVPQNQLSSYTFPIYPGSTSLAVVTEVTASTDNIGAGIELFDASITDTGVRGTLVVSDTTLSAIQVDPTLGTSDPGPTSATVTATSLPEMGSNMDGFSTMAMVANESFLETTELLYTWGYGSLYLMGNGGAVATNTLPISQNGLSSIYKAAMASGVMVVVALTGTPIVPPEEEVITIRSQVMILG